MTGMCDNFSASGAPCPCEEFNNNPNNQSQKNDTLEEGDLCVVPDSVIAAKSSEIDRPIVGIVSHRFVGEGKYCNGLLGYAPTDPRHGAFCNRPKEDEIHEVYDELGPAAGVHDVQSPTEPPVSVESGLKDSGERLNFASGMVRDIQTDKPRFDLVIPKGMPYTELMLTRWAELLRKGAIKYAERNWELADSDDELERAYASAFRHFIQWFTGETDEDHAAAVFFNITEVEYIKWKQKQKGVG